MTFSDLTLEQKKELFELLEIAGRKGKEAFQRWEERIDESNSTPFLSTEQKGTLVDLLEEGFEALINALGSTIPTPDIFAVEEE